MLEAASVRRRLVARVIDFLFLIPITFAAAVPVLIVCLPLFLLFDGDAVTTFAAFLCFVVAYLAIEFFLLLRREGQTLGKGLMGLRVMQAAKDVTLSPAQAASRIAATIGPFILATGVYYSSYDSATGDTTNPGAYDAAMSLWLVTGLACLLSAAADRARRRGLHDRLAGSRVVRAPRRGVSASDFKMMVPSSRGLAPVSLSKQSPPDGGGSYGQSSGIDFSKP